eukprot:PhF_6_TR32057/c0_g1_i1/m.47477
MWRFFSSADNVRGASRAAAADLGTEAARLRDLSWVAVWRSSFFPTVKPGLMGAGPFLPAFLAAFFSFLAVDLGALRAFNGKTTSLPKYCLRRWTLPLRLSSLLLTRRLSTEIPMVRA